MNEYMTDEELQKLISDIEENNLVKAPPEIETKVFNKIHRNKQIIEYRRFKNRVITAVAAILIITAFSPTLEGFIPEVFLQTTYNKDVYTKLENNTLNEILGVKMLGDIANSRYISDLLNEREE